MFSKFPFPIFHYSDVVGLLFVCVISISLPAHFLIFISIAKYSFVLRCVPICICVVADVSAVLWIGVYAYVPNIFVTKVSILYIVWFVCFDASLI